MFIGRKNELDTLNKLYETQEFQMVVIYGRRRIGKTTLITEFMKNKPAIFFTAQEANDKINLEHFSLKVYRFFHMPEGTGAFISWNTAFDFISEKAKNTQFILTLDEFSYACDANKGLKSILQNAIDLSMKNTKLYLILCGSHVGFMENEVLGYKSPLFGRRTAQIKLEGFDYYDTAKMLQYFSNEDKIKLYACLGGTPYYLSLVKEDLSFEENITNLFFEKSGFLYNEPTMLLKQELREPAMYNSIISAIATGASKINEIATKIGEERTKLTRYLNTLMDMGIIDKLVPFGEDKGKSKRGIYCINDNCYSFWYRFIFPNISEIEAGTGSTIANILLNSEMLNTYIGKPGFELVCMQYLIRKNQDKQLPFQATSFGKWWGNNSVKRVQTDIDIIAANKFTKELIEGECKWKNNIDDVSEIKKLIEKDCLLSDYPRKYFYLFSKVDFQPQAKELEKSEKRLHLIRLQDMFD